jgi:inner membrane protein
LLSALIYLLNKYAGVAFFLGYLLHLLIDSLTPQGVKLFWPLTNFKIRFIIKSGSIIEEIIFVICLLINLILIIRIIFR